MRDVWLDQLRTDIYRSLFSDECDEIYSLKRSGDPCALYILGMRHLPFTNTGMYKGFNIIIKGNKCFIDPPFHLYKHAIPDAPLPVPQKDSLYPLFSLYRLIRDHMTDSEDQPSMRLLVKAMETDQLALAGRITALQAERLRMHIGLSKWLLPWLHHWIVRS